MFGLAFCRRALRTVMGLALATGLSFGTSAQQPMQTNIGAATASDGAPAFIGVERGIFAKYGLNVRVVMYPTGAEMINGMLNGANDVSILGGNALQANRQTPISNN